MSTFKAEQDELFGGGASSSKPVSKPKTVAKPVRAAAASVKPPQSTEAKRQEPTVADKKKKEEAAEMAIEAEKLITKPRFGFFWSAEPYRAAKLFEKAGTKLLTTPYGKEARDYFCKAADNYHADGYPGNAMLVYKSAAASAVRDNNFEEAAHFYERVAQANVESNQIQPAADSYVKAGEALPNDTDKSIELFNQACNLILRDPKDAQHTQFKATAHEVFGKAIDWMVSHDRLEEALGLFERYEIILHKNEMDHSLANMRLSEAILYLHIGDVVKAYDRFTAHLQDDEYLHSKQCKAEEDLITAMKTNNLKALIEAKHGNPCIARLGKGVQNLAMGLTLEAELVNDDDGAGSDSDDDDEEDTINDSVVTPPPLPKGIGSQQLAVPAPAVESDDDDDEIDDEVLAAAPAVSKPEPSAPESESDEEDDEDLT